MCEISDEMLMAYADGELADDLRVRVETYLAEDPDGQRRLATFALTGRSLAEIFNRPMREPVPQRLIALVRGIPTGRLQSATSTDVKHAALDRRRRTPTSTARTLAIAASLAALVATSAGSLWFFKSKPINADYGLAMSFDRRKIADEALVTALETAPSGSVVAQTIDGGPASIRPSFTFLTGKGEYCRQYEINSANALGFSGVACREANRAWRIETQVASAPHHTANGAIVPAGKDIPASVEAAVDRLISGDVLGAEEEAGAISGGWRAIHQ